jgi:hypothetical protein
MQDRYGRLKQKREISLVSKGSSLIGSLSIIGFIVKTTLV